MKVAVGSRNPVKVGAVKSTFSDIMSACYELEVPSGVSDQPLSDEETIEGAINRARACLGVVEDADIGIGLEGGVVDTELGMFVCNWGAISDRSGNLVVSGGARFLLPQEVAAGVRAGRELGPVMDDYTQTKDVRKKEGAIGIFTNGRITRQDMYAHLVMALRGQYEYYRPKSEA